MRSYQSSKEGQKKVMKVWIFVLLIQLICGFESHQIIDELFDFCLHNGRFFVTFVSNSNEVKIKPSNQIRFRLLTNFSFIDDLDTLIVLKNESFEEILNAFSARKPLKSILVIQEEKFSKVREVLRKLQKNLNFILFSEDSKVWRQIIALNNNPKPIISILNFDSQG